MIKKKICFVITKSEVGGAQKWVKEQIDILHQHGYQCYLSTNSPGWLTQNSKGNYHTDKRIEKRTSIGYLLSLRKYLTNNKIDLVIGNSANGGIYSRLVTIFSKRKCIYVSHGWSSVYNGGKLKFLFNWIEKMLSVISDKILCVSSNDYQIALHQIGISPKKLSVIPNKIFPVSESNVLNTKKSNKFTILFLGRLAPPKSPIPIIEAIKDSEAFELDIVGSGPDYQHVEKYIKDKSINNARLLGEIKNFNTFSSYHIFCLISKSEGLPLSAVEALSCGLPILISNVGGCPELVNNNGYLTNNTPTDILKGLQLIEENYTTFCLNSKKLFAEKFDLSVNYKKYINLYENV